MKVSITYEFVLYAHFPLQSTIEGKFLKVGFENNFLKNFSAHKFIGREASIQYKLVLNTHFHSFIYFIYVLFTLKTEFSVNLYLTSL